MKTNSMVVSEAVLALLETRFTDKDKCWVEFLSNGREQGFTMFSRDSEDTISWFENRNSDEIVVMNNNKKTFFNSGDFNKVVEFIIKSFGQQKVS